jgi:hypothetical protein
MRRALCAARPCNRLNNPPLINLIILLLQAKAQGMGKKGTGKEDDRAYSRGNYGSLLDDEDKDMKV